MLPTQILDNLQARGFTLSLNGDALRVVPASALTIEDRANIKANKPGLVALLLLRSVAASCVPAEWPQMLRPTRELIEAHKAAELASGEGLTLNGRRRRARALRRNEYDAGAAYRSEEGKAARAQMARGTGPLAIGNTSTAAPNTDPVIVEVDASQPAPAELAETTALNLTRYDSIARQWLQ